jgi:hypothetical protein
METRQRSVTTLQQVDTVATRKLRTLFTRPADVSIERRGNPQRRTRGESE